MSFEDDDDDEDWIDRCLAKGMGFKSPEERQAYLDSIGDPEQHPLFAGSREDMKDHPLATAFDELAEEKKTSNENAVIYKDEGNMALKKGAEYYDMARIKYHTALTYIVKAEKEMSEDYVDTSAPVEVFSSPILPSLYEACEKPTLPEDEAGKKEYRERTAEIKYQIYSNLSMLELTLKNYRQCIENANMSISIEPSTIKNAKAYFRKIKALVTLRKFAKAIELCLFVLESSKNIPHAPPVSPDIPKLLELSRREQKVDEIKAYNKTNELIAYNKRRESSYKEAWDIFQKFKLHVTPATLDHPGQMKIYYPTYDKSLHLPKFPVLLVYPQYKKFDIIEGVTELEDMIAVHLAEIFPELEDENQEPAVPWDVENEYHVSNLSVYNYIYPTLTQESDTSSCGIIKSLCEWIFSCQSLHEIKTGNSAFIKPLPPPEGVTPPSTVSDCNISLDMDHFDSLTGFNAEREDKKTEKDYMLLRKSYYMKELSKKTEYLNKNSVKSHDHSLINIHLGCTFKQILQTKGLILPGGLLTLIVYPNLTNGRNNKAHEQFLKRNATDDGFSVKYLNPTGEVVNNL